MVSGNGVLTNGNHSIKKPLIHVESPNVTYTNDFVTSEYTFQSTQVRKNSDGHLTVVTPVEQRYSILTKLHVPKTGLMMVGWGGNNGSTVTAGILANKLGISWQTKTGQQYPNYYGSLTQAATMRLGIDEQGNDVYVPFSQFLPMVDPNDLVLGGWDISGKNLAEATERAQVLEPDLQRQLKPYLTNMKPLPSIYYPDFVAANQSKRADNLIPGNSKREHLNQLRRDIANFKSQHHLDTVIVVWTATTERYSDVIEGVNDTWANLEKSIENSHAEVAPSTIFALASILEAAPFINGSPQNTFVPGCLELAEKLGVFIGGDDFKTGQTKIKSVLVDFLVSAGIKPLAITSYNHLGNNDGENLSSPPQFRSKEISKSSVVDDMVSSNDLLYGPREKPDHVIVIKYVPSVGDSKRAMDEYYSEIFLGGRNTIAIHNTCEDSLLAAPLIIDLCVMAEFFTRVQYKKLVAVGQADEKVTAGQKADQYESFGSVLSVLSYFLKAPLVPKGWPVVNALFRQRQCVENVLRACLGMPPQNYNIFENMC